MKSEKKENPTVEEAQTIVAKEVEKEVDTNLDELVKLLKNGDGYFSTITVLSNQRLSHHLITKNFPDLDILKSIAAIEKMAVERLKAL